MFPWRFWEPHALIHARPFISHIRIKSPPLNTVVVSSIRSSTRLPTRYSHFWHHSSDYDPIKAQKAKPFLTLNQITRVITSRTAKCIYVLIGGGASVFYVQHLETAPVSGRKRFMYFTDADAEEEGKLIYASLMRENRHAILPSWDWRTQKVNRVMKRLIVASGLDNLDWEVNVISSNLINAFILPGGKVFVMSGILPIAETDSGLAVVLSHEMAHGIASHRAESMSKSLLVIWPLRFIFFFFFDFWTSGILGNIFLEFGLNRPASRTHEREADYIGLMIMAKACYDPRAAVIFWKRMCELEAIQGKRSFAWLSTHPSTSSRAELIQKWLPKAVAVSKESDCSAISRYYDMFRFTKPENFGSNFI